MASGGSELVAILTSGVLYSKLGLKKSFSLLFAVSCAGGCCILFLGEQTEGILLPIFVVFTKFGIAGAFVLLYSSTVEMFPTLFSATALGFCNFFARIITIFAPLVAEQDPPLPMLLFVIFTALGSVVIWFAKPLAEQKK